MSEEWQLTFQPFLVNLVALEIYIAFVIAVGVALVITLVFGRVREGETPTKVSAGFCWPGGPLTSWGVGGPTPCLCARLWCS